MSEATETAEFQPPQLAALQALAVERGIDDPARLAGLDEKVRGILERNGTDAGSYRENGLMIGAVVKHPDGYTASEVHFAPKTPTQMHGATKTATRGEAPTVILKGIQAMQNYVLLADAGVVNPPETIFGLTNNDAMAKTAERIGFETTRLPGKSGGQLSGRFEDIRTAVFSPEIQRLEQVLEKRLARTAQAVGSTAIA